MYRVLAATLWVTGCYSPAVEDCAYQCGAGARCPNGMHCDQTSNLCRVMGASGSCGSGSGDAGCETCATSCVNKQNDPNNCGQCGLSCASGKCSNGKCAHRAFVTLATYANGMLAQNIDLQCQQAADAQDLGGTFVAWISTTTSAPYMTLIDDGGEYILADEKRTVIAANWAELTDGSLDAPINVTEMGDVYTGPHLAVWTNTSISGEAVETDPGLYCNNWSSAVSTYSARYGLLDQTDVRWTNASTLQCCCGTGCDGCPAHLYCFEK